MVPKVDTTVDTITTCTKEYPSKTRSAASELFLHLAFLSFLSALPVFHFSLWLLNLLDLFRLSNLIFIFLVVPIFLILIVPILLITIAFECFLSRTWPLSIQY